jgi:hypothetical protein
MVGTPNFAAISIKQQITQGVRHYGAALIGKNGASGQKVYGVIGIKFYAGFIAKKPIISFGLCT